MSCGFLWLCIRKCEKVDAFLRFGVHVGNILVDLVRTLCSRECHQSKKYESHVLTRLEYSWAKTLYTPKSKSKGRCPKNKGFGRNSRLAKREISSGGRGGGSPRKILGILKTSLLIEMTLLNWFSWKCYCFSQLKLCIFLKKSWNTFSNSGMVYDLPLVWWVLDGSWLSKTYPRPTICP